MEIQGKKITFSKPELKLLMEWSSADLSRWNISAVWIEIENGRAWGTDGHRLACVKAGSGSTSAKNSEEIFGITRENVKAILKMAGAKDLITIDLSDTDHAFATIGGATVPFERHNANPPTMAQVIPSAEPNAVTVGLKAEYFAGVGALEKIQKGASVRISVQGELDPVLFESDFVHSAWTLVIMPVRM